MYQTPYHQYPSINQARPGLAYSGSIPVRRTPNVVGAGPPQQTGPVPFLRQSSNGPYGFSNAISQPQPQSSALQQSQLLSSNAHAQSANDGQKLDLNDFPALGAGVGSSTAGVGTGTGNSANTGTHINASYAAQAQHHPTSTPSANQSLGNGVTRDFTNPEDFPALGGQSTAHDAHVPSQGANGYQSQQGGMQSISILRNNMLPTDEKRAYVLKQNPQTPSSWSQHPSGPTGYGQTTNGVQHQAQGSFTSQQQPQTGPSITGQALQDNISTLDPASTTNQQQLVQPHTPADQVLHSAADRWGLLALVRALRQQTDDSLSSGQDLGLLGMELDNPGSLYPKFATPWADYTSPTPTTEPNYHLPSCYNVAPPPPNPKKTAQFSDETLFFTFYSMPRDVFQDLAAQELYNRGWRYHKGQRLWVTTEGTVPPPDAQRQSVEGGIWCTVWDVEAWERQTRMMRIDLRELENREPTTNIPNTVGSIGGERSQLGASSQMLPQGSLSQQQQQQQQQHYSQASQQHLRM
ncbi:hypothetical protein CPB86DRAFT_764737 [Serendipita vermifera]|nr:hypothetical protein CPB86DRAFT_764737 [Serendipita vermifera]